MLFSLYRTLTFASAPVLNRMLQKRLKKSKEDPARYGERRGVTDLKRPQGKVMWLHGASVGEALSALPLLDELKIRLPEWRFLVTTGTVTSANLLAKRLPEDVIHQYVPWDHPVWVKRFLNHWRPDAVLWLESELWPNMLHEFARRDIPAALLNARMRPKTFARWQKAKGFAAKMLGSFRFILVGARDYIRYFEGLGGKNISYAGSLKFGAKALPVDAAKLAELRAAIGGRPCMAFLQTHPTEEGLAADIYAGLKKTMPDLLLIVAPRKNTRGREIKAELSARQLQVSVRTMDEAITAQTEIYVADTIGEMSLWYNLASIAVIGGSFIYFGGQNPIEGMHFGCPVLYGPSMFNFPELCLVLEEAGAAKKIDSRAALLPALLDLYAQPEKMAAMRQAASQLAGQNHSVIQAFADKIITELVTAR
ncbi:MAG: kdtA [Alphaproteobacteria bacterium]|nr:kdtA [Alphaproteobacteria bacterium]